MLFLEWGQMRPVGSQVVKFSNSWAIILAGILLLVASSPAGAANGATGKKPITLKDVDANPSSYLGQSLVLNGWLAPQSKPVATGAELAVRIDSKTPILRLRFWVPKSFANRFTAWKEPRPVRLTGTVIAAESARDGFLFEIDELAVLDESNKVVETLKPEPEVRPAKEPSETHTTSVPSAPKSESAKPVEPIKKGGVPTVLIVGAALMAGLLVVLAVIGIRLMKYMKIKPKSRPRRLAVETTVTSPAAS